MKLTFSFQTLILSVLSATLALATAVWAVTVYDSVYNIILRGFDQKLLAVGGGAAVFTDGDAHADYHREHRPSAFGPGPEGQFLLWDQTRSMLLRVDPEAGGALPWDAAAGWELPATVLSLAYSAQDGGVALLDGERRLLRLLPGGAAEADADAQARIASEPGADQFDQVLYLEGRLFGRRGQEVLALQGEPERLVLAEPVMQLAGDAEGERLVGLSAEADAILLLDRQGQLIARHDVDLGGRAVAGLAVQDGVLYLAADTLLSFDLEDAALGEEPPPPGYFSEAHPFIERFAPAYRQVRERAGLTFLYTDVHLGGDQIRYILDGSVGDDHTPPGYLDTVPEDSVDEIALAQSRGESFVSDVRQWEAWGLIKISAEPIFASSGQAVALAGADVDAGVIRAKTRNALFAVLFVGLGLLLLAGSVSYRVSQGLTRPLREIKNSALRIAAGYFDTKLQREADDEIGDLAASLNALSDRLQAQARQSEAYQQALIGGRMQLALLHALCDGLAQARRTLPLERLVDDDTRVERSAATGDARHCLVWQLSLELPDLEQAVLQARTARLADHLLQRTTPEKAQRALFETLPVLAAVALWQADTQTLQLRCRQPVTLLHTDAAGAAVPRVLDDGQSLRLEAGDTLAWDGSLLLRCVVPTESLTG